MNTTSTASPIQSPQPSASLENPPLLPAQRLWTERLRLEASQPVLAPAVSDFFLGNAAHLAPWGPSRPPGFWEVEATEARLTEHIGRFAASELWQYWLTRIDDPDRIIGQCQVSLISRGVFQNASIGYGLAEAAQGHGYMQEALRCLIDELFSPRVWLHRLEAAVRPDNLRSLRMMERMGFREIGLCRNYLYIQGTWRDFQLFELLNPQWPADLAPAY